MNKILAIIAAVLGVGFLGLTFVYWTTPASKLPAFFPGYAPFLMEIHFKHGLLALILAILLFIFAWFISGPSSAKNH